MALIRSSVVLATAILLAGACKDSSAPAGTPVTITLARPSTNPPFAAANGTAKFDNAGGERELEIQVEDVPPGTALVFFLDNIQIAAQNADALGNVRLNLRSEGSGGVVPTSVGGKVLSVRTAAGAVVLSATFPFPPD